MIAAISPRGFLLFSFFSFLLFAFASCDIAAGGGWEGEDGEGAGSEIVPGDAFAEKIAWLKANAQSGGHYLIEVSEDEGVYQTLLYFLNRINITITIRGVGGNRTVTLLYRGNMFYVFAGVTLVLDGGVTLAGYDDNVYPLIYIADGGVLRMNSGAVVTGNISGVTGGVYVDGGTFVMNGGAIRGNIGGSICGSAVTLAGGTFTMNGGVISGNEAISGGTVTMTGGSFVMNGGTISGNNARSGGGVMLARGAFTMNSGNIRGNTAADSGGAVLVGVAGAFTMNGGTISGNTAKAYGGAVSVGLSGNFCMIGGAISGNTAAYYGWGVYVSGTFTKSGGTIAGYEGVGGAGGGANANAVEPGDLGLAVYAYSASGVRKRKETTAGPEANLSYSGRNGEWSGDWDF